jgi:hypothetical protein
MAKYVDLINDQAATINQLLDDIHLRGGSSSSAAPMIWRN